MIRIAGKDAMTISPHEAGAMLADVDDIVARVKQSRIYRTSSRILMFWGVVVVFGNLILAIMPRWAGWSWAALDLIGVGMTVWALRGTRAAHARFPIRALAAFALFFAFGWTWSEILAHFGPRQLDAFWPTMFLLGYALAGLWFGIAFTAVGVGLAALIVAGFLWSGEWFPLYLAMVNGGGLILCGYAMRRA